MNRTFFLAGAVLLLVSSGWFLSQNRQAGSRLDANPQPVDREDKDVNPSKGRFAEDRPDPKAAPKLPAFSGAKAIDCGSAPLAGKP